MMVVGREKGREGKMREGGEEWREGGREGRGEGGLALRTPSSDDSTEVATKRMVVMVLVVLVMVWPWWERGEEEGVQAEDAC